MYFNLRNGDFYNSVDSGVPWEMSISPDSRNLLAEPLPNGVRLLYGGVIIPKGDIRYRRTTDDKRTSQEESDLIVARWVPKGADEKEGASSSK